MSTSTAATRRLSLNQDRVLDHFREAGETGFTFDEIERKFLNLSGSRVRTIVSELVKLGLVRSSGHTATSQTGRRQTIWIAAVN